MRRRRPGRPESLGHGPLWIATGQSWTSVQGPSSTPNPTSIPLRRETQLDSGELFLYDDNQRFVFCGSAVDDYRFAIHAGALVAGEVNQLGRNDPRFSGLEI